MGLRLVLATLVACLGFAHTVAAQDGPPLGEFSVQRFSPAPGAGNYLATDGAQVSGHLVPSAGLTLDYQHDPFVLYRSTCAVGDPTDCQVHEVEDRLVRYQLTFFLHGTLTLYDRVQIGLVMPLVFGAGDTFSFTYEGNPIDIGHGNQFFPGDPRLSAKVGLFDQGDEGLDFAVVAYATAPIGQLGGGEGSYIGENGPTFGGHFVGEFTTRGIHVAGNIGGVYRNRTTLLSTQVGSAITYRVAFGYDITPLLMVFGELDGSSSFTSQVDENPMELRAGAQFRQGDFVIHGGLGTGIISGVGVPVIRVTAGAAWQPLREDSDGDGILDPDDACPSDPEDMDDWEDEDGCPEADNDGDGMLDADDGCPDQAEDVDEFQDEDGCPDTDNDGDGVTDGFDSCPNEPEDMDGDRDEDGCPDNDTDRDGIPDDQDACPDEPEDTDGFGDEDGCPEVDFDGDGIPDDQDECPDAAETINGTNDEDGCPEEDADNDGIADEADRCPNEPETLNGVDDDDGCPDGEVLVQVTETEIQLMQQVQFATNRATIRGRTSQRILDAVATILRRNPQYRNVRVEGHTDDRGDHDRNMRLSQDRAQAVVDALVQRGIGADRLHPQGFGPDRPIADNDSTQGRAQNRRVEFHIEPASPAGH